jgi:hypothetical protein
VKITNAKTLVIGKGFLLQEKGKIGMEVKELDKIIHNDLLPIQQAFKSYEQLACNGCFRFDPKIFRKCSLKIQLVIDTARQLTKEE